MARLNRSARAIVIQGGKILLIHRLKGGIEYFVFPGGGVEDYEIDDSITVKRELFEETGMTTTECRLAFEEKNKHGGMDKYYYCSVLGGVPHLTGEELDRDTAENHYDPAWFDLSILNQENVYPESVRLRLLAGFKTPHN